jgi:type II secretory pathway component GspD/PulD (secretin)
MLLLAVGQANQQQPEEEGEQFIAAEPVLRVSADGLQAEAEAEGKPKLTARPQVRQQPKIVAPRLIATPEKAVVPEGEMPNRKAIRVKHTPAVDVANAIRQLLGDEPHDTSKSCAIVAEPITNTILISAAPAMVDQIESLLAVMDQKPASIQIDAALIQVTRGSAAEDASADLPSRAWDEGTDAALRELRQRGVVRVLARPTLLALSNQAAYVQIGRRESRVTGVRESPQGRSNQIELENVGCILGVTARANDENWITMEVDLEDSRLGDREQGAVLATMPDGEVIRSPGVDVATMQSTICVRSGQAVVLGSVVEERDGRYTEFWMIVEARLVERGE